LASPRGILPCAILALPQVRVLNRFALTPTFDFDAYAHVKVFDGKTGTEATSFFDGDPALLGGMFVG
jgi:hypothetical protein